MDTTKLTSPLVETYKTLNMKYRHATESPEVKEIVGRMRNDEIAFSQALRDHLTGVGTASGKRMMPDPQDEPLFQIISQFGTARATTLNLLRGIHDENVWARSTEDGKSIGEHVEALVESDKQQLERLSQAASA